MVRRVLFLRVHFWSGLVLISIGWEVVKAEVKEEREEVGCTKERVSSSGSSNFTLRNSQSGANPTSTPPHSISPFSVPPPPLFTPPFFPLFQTPQYCQMPAANWGFCGGCQCWGPVIPILAVQQLNCEVEPARALSEIFVKPCFLYFT